ncbi:uncharacterized protein K444DRAFT_623024 [Hyaloscypha bicolor E]|uniref:Uncharacterized protein n=1 Tax=Hyaloscypha bicolor E TaxID=1095630 RepID=A0A2J6SFC3_9HELO|nr:uncharacterized protein K444DRAFT_623024 [Hyaloscypha bicolor E]PMD49471.1 hypothetical protein K444DRAFT_623024 [Hyaloscypha bicolor E]
MAVNRQVKPSSQGWKSTTRKRRLSSIVYDPAREKLSVESIPVEKLTGYTPVDCPGSNSHVDIFIDIGEGVTKTLIARVDLSKLSAILL